MRDSNLLQHPTWNRQTRHLSLAAVIALTLGTNALFLSPSRAQTTGETPFIPPTNLSDVTSPVESSLSDITSPQSPGRSQIPVSGPFTVPRLETELSLEYASHLGFPSLYGDVSSVTTIATTLARLGRETNSRPALVYLIPTVGEGLNITVVLPDFEGTGVAQQPSNTKIASKQLLVQDEGQPTTPNIIRKTVPEATLRRLKRVTKSFRREVSNPARTATTSYLKPAQILHRWIMEPMLEELETNKIDTVVFSMGRGLRSLPIAAIHDGQQFLVEKYNLALIPSFSLTDTRYKPVQGSRMLGVGISEATDGQTPLPAVAVEVPTLTDTVWQGQSLLNRDATLANLQSSTQQQDFSIIHLATHGRFQPGRLDNSYIQLWNSKLKLSDLRTLSLESKWNTNPTMEMLVLSACQTALGSPEAELGFTGLAVQTGVKTAIGSLWFVSDAGSLGLMTEFYRRLQTAPLRAAALRKAQEGMIRGEVKIVDGQLALPEAEPIALPTGLVDKPNVDLSHPYFWSAFTVVGNWN